MSAVQDTLTRPAPSFADFPLDDGETLADALDRALHDCSGAEPSLSILYIRAEQTVPILRELYEALDLAYRGGMVDMAGSDFRDRVEAILAKVRGA